MSGIVGILQLDQAPVDPRLLQRLTSFQSFRGPDAQNVWIDGHIGFGHTLLKTAEGSAHERQPFSLDGNVWIVADARVDGRQDLTAKLHTYGYDNLESASDASLILRAYDVWGENCVAHLLGDFAFGIWDKPKQRLFCARDHMGVKPFYYAHVGARVIFSNTLDCLRQHPDVSERLNELAIADFLLLEVNQDPGTTSFADIHRLPPAHRATWSQSGSRVTRYWTMPVDEPIFYKHADDYVDHFRSLLREVVSDRIRTDRVAIFMSGGLDSTTLTVSAHDLLRERSANFDLRAFTRTDPYAPGEQDYAGLVADRLGIAIQYDDWGDRSVNPNWERIPLHTPEPSATPWQVLAYQDYCRQIAPCSRVFLYGEGPDNALHFEWRPYVSYLVRKRRYVRLFRDLCSTVVTQRRPPFWGRISRKLRARRPRNHAESASFPNWLNPSLESRLQLSARWRKLVSPPRSMHPLRPKAYASLHIPLWQGVFERYDPAWTTAAFEVRYPFIDLRMLRFLLAVPALPWCRSKHLIRRAMLGALPKPVLGRQKSGVACAAVMDRVGRSGLTPLVPTEGLSSYVDAEHLPNTVCGDMWEFGGHLRVRSLNHWLQCLPQKLQNAGREDCLNEAVPEQAAGITEETV